MSGKRKDHPLERPEEPIKECNLETGMYGTRGERLRHVAYPTALYLPGDALDLMNNIESKQVELPHQDSVERPSAVKETMVVTELTGRYVQQAQPPTPFPPQQQQQVPPQPPRMVFRTMATNKRIRLDHLVPRIRGGGEEEEQNASAAKDTSTASSAEAGLSASLQAAKASGEEEPEKPAATTTSSSKTTTTPSESTDTKPQAVASTNASATDTPVVTTSGTTTANTEATDAQPKQDTSDSGPAVTTETAPKVDPQVIPLDKKPAAQWEQHGTSENVPGQTKLPSWYQPNEISDVEKAGLPEWFNETATHRTPETYKEAREQLLKMTKSLQDRHLTATMLRRSIPGDAGSLVRLHQFWMTQGRLNDSTPTPQCLRLTDQLKPGNPGLTAEAENIQVGKEGKEEHSAVAFLKSEETAVAVLLQQILDARMKQVEERLKVLDDVEGLLEADRVALELERRDLFTARCRHWFGGT